MKHRDRTRTRNYSEIWIVGSADEVTQIVQAAQASGRLLHASAPRINGPDDPRYARYLRLRTS